MSDRSALLEAIRLNPDDDTPRVIYADYLQGEGRRDGVEGGIDDKHAELIRAMCRLAQLPEYGFASAKLIQWAKSGGYDPGSNVFMPTSFSITAMMSPDFVGFVGSRYSLRLNDGTETRIVGGLMLDRQEMMHVGVQGVCVRCNFQSGCQPDPDLDERIELTDRVKALSDELEPHLLAPCYVCHRINAIVGESNSSDPHCHVCRGSGRIGEFSRGFCDKVSIPFIGTLFDQTPHTLVNGQNLQPKSSCPITDYARKLVAQCPTLNLVSFRDIMNWLDTRGDGSHSINGATVPLPVWRNVHKHLPPHGKYKLRLGSIEFPNRYDASFVLSRAIATTLHELAASESKVLV
jgi:uncharacterized protein (TIGR02996 family)